MIEEGIALALASDFNPGSCPSFNMQLMVSLACILYGILPAQAINMATINSAYALGIGEKVGSLSAGKQADLLILDIDTYKKLPYFFGQNHVETIIKKGKVVR
jgi:imidazolonepropionase